MKKIFFSVLILTFVNSVLIGQTNNSAITNCTTEQFKSGIEKDKSAVIIDLRTTDEINRGFIKGSIQLDFLAKDAEKQIDKLDKNKSYYIYCAAGGRSADAAEYMNTHGFKKIYNLQKGFSAWAKAGYPVEKK